MPRLSRRVAFSFPAAVLALGGKMPEPEPNDDDLIRLCVEIEAADAAGGEVPDWIEIGRTVGRTRTYTVEGAIAKGRVLDRFGEPGPKRMLIPLTVVS